MPSVSQTGRLLQITTVLGDDVLLMDALQGVEGISHLFDFQVDLLAESDAEIDPKSLIGTKATIEIRLLEVQGNRYINGLIAAFEQMSGSDDEFAHYRLRLVPSLWQLRLSTNCRVFQAVSVMDIVKKVISPYGLSITDKTEGTLQVLDYCTQYNETDFDFISRITEQHGIFYWFEHSEDDNKVIFANSRTPYADCPLVNKAKYFTTSADREESYRSIIHDISATASMVSGKHTHWDYDFRPYKQHEIDSKDSTSPYGQNAYERYNWPSGEESYVKLSDKQNTTPNHGAGFIAAIAGASDAGAEVYRGHSTARSFCPGYTFEMTDNPRAAWNRAYLLTEVVHSADQMPPYRSTGAAGAALDTGYTNSFKAITSDVLFQPPQLTRRPRIYGPQTARVVTAAGEEIHLDKYGRVNVQFLWDRERKPNSPDNTWLRVGQPWASNGWGAYFWPRVNDEVIVQFIDGDPDNPIVVGSVYNGTNMPPYPLPDNGTRSGILTRSSKGGSASTANELRFEDKKGQEQIYIHAEKNMDVSIENNLSTSIGAQESRTVGASQFEQVGSEVHRTIGSNLFESVGSNANVTIGGNQSEAIGGNLSQSVGSNHDHEIGQNLSVTAGQNTSITGGMNVTITAGMNLSLVGPGGFITIGPAGVAISGTMVLINSGGAAGSGQSASTTTPDKPKAPEKAEGAS